MSADKEREAVKNAYSHNPSFQRRVQTMPENQVIAIYNRLKNERKL